MKYFIAVLFFIALSPLSALTLSDEFRRAEVGDYVVFLEQKHLTLFRIASKNDKEIGIEEITAQEQGINPQTANWQQWLQEGAPNHTSWTLSLLDLETGAMKASYSYTTNEWQANQTVASFLPTLLQLPLETVPLDLRKRIGPPPEKGEQEARKLWTPKVTFHHTAVPQVPFAVYRAEWPQDESDLRGKVVLLYFATGKATECLSYFPYWIEVVGLVGRVKLRVIDSGKGLESPQLLPVMNSSP